MTRLDNLRRAMQASRARQLAAALCVLALFLFVFAATKTASASRHEAVAGSPGLFVDSYRCAIYREGNTPQSPDFDPATCIALATYEAETDAANADRNSANTATWLAVAALFCAALLAFSRVGGAVDRVLPIRTTESNRRRGAETGSGSASKLGLLDAAWQQGLISDADYARQRRELLSSPEGNG